MSTRSIALAISCTFLLFSATDARAQLTEAQISAGIKRGTDALKKLMSDKASEYGQVNSIAGYAMLKGKVPPSDSTLQSIARTIRAKVSKNDYTNRQPGNYVAGCDLMFLEALDAKGYRKEIEYIAKYLIKNQHETGTWDYVEQEWRGGDTSQCQYALLGLWAAQRAGVEIPIEVWDKAANWHMRMQFKGGAFAYHPIGKQDKFKVPQNTMTVNGVASMTVCKMHLFPNDIPRKTPTKSKAKFGVLTKVDLDSAPNGDTKPEPTANVRLDPLKTAITKGETWAEGNFVVRNREWPYYYLYGLERMAALSDLQTLKGQDWFKQGAGFILSTQAKDGTWKGDAGPAETTSFAVLFLSRSTGKILGRAPGIERVAGGLQRGARGLPDDFGKAQMKDGKVEEQKVKTPLEELLAELEKLDGAKVEDAQKEIVRKVTIGDKEALIKQKDRLVDLATNRNFEVRRTAIWALGHTSDLGLARLLIDALDDSNEGVVIEARNALCTLARKPRGFGLSDDPYVDLPDGASIGDQKKAFEAWRFKIKRAWKAWFYRIRPYDQRDDLEELIFKASTRRS